MCFNVDDDGDMVSIFRQAGRSNPHSIDVPIDEAPNKKIRSGENIPVVEDVAEAAGVAEGVVEDEEGRDKAAIQAARRTSLRTSNDSDDRRSRVIISTVSGRESAWAWSWAWAEFTFVLEGVGSVVWSEV